MKHLSTDRLLTLGLSPDLEPLDDESAHLARCRECADRLAEERALSAAIAELPQPAPPAAFTAKTTTRYLQAFAARRARRTAMLITVALLAAGALLIPMAGILVASAGPVLAGLATVVEYLVTVGHALLVVLSKLPPVTAAVLLVICGMALASSLLLGKLAIATAPAK